MEKKILLVLFILTPNLCFSEQGTELKSRNLQNEKISFQKSIVPILKRSCIKCHGPNQQKGGLRLDSPEAILKGGKNGLIFMARKPEESPLYVLTTLPPDDIDVMPAKGQPLTKSETELIRQWILQGALFDQKGDSQNLEMILTREQRELIDHLMQMNVQVKQLKAKGHLVLDFKLYQGNFKNALKRAIQLNQLIEEIHLHENPLTKESLTHLNRFKKLKKITLKNDVNQKIIDELKKNNPNLEINLMSNQ